ncbi:MAG: class I SAM-dependent methyltransferase, partial [Rhodospirillales bacterium]|nr:class I SAM-dependent methyltransferase [Rhodospirillales bacterium]
MFFEYAFLVTVVIGVSVSLFYCAVTGISPIPSSAISRDCILDCMPDGFSGTVAELGAGWGSLAFPLAAAFPDAQILAYELSPVPWLFMHMRQIVFRRKNLTISRANFMKRPMGGVTA